MYLKTHPAQNDAVDDKHTVNTSEQVFSLNARAHIKSHWEWEWKTRSTRKRKEKLIVLVTACVAGIKLSVLDVLLETGYVLARVVHALHAARQSTTRAEVERLERGAAIQKLGQGLQADSCAVQIQFSEIMQWLKFDWSKLEVWFNFLLWSIMTVFWKNG